MMRTIILLLFPVMARLMAFSPIVISPEYRINASAWSDKILLVEITKVTLTDEKVANGIGGREITVEGTVIEVIRGEQKSKTFRASKNLVRVVDTKAVEASSGAGALEVLLSAPNDQTGIVDCKKGNRYVVNYPVSYSRLQDVFFAEVAKDKDDWRKQILPLEAPPGEEPPKKN